MTNGLAAAFTIVWFSGVIGVGTALDLDWGRMRDKDGRCEWFCDLVVKPVVVLSWPIWMPGLLAHRATR